MNTELIWYTVWILLLIGMILSYGYFTVKKVINMRDTLFIAAGVLFITLFALTSVSSKDISEKLSTEFKVPKDFYSSESYTQDSILTDEILYNYMLDMRIKHAKVILCQAKIESSNYTSPLYKKNSNLFGMKTATQRVSTPGIGRAGYKSYNHWTESVTDYVLWQLTHNADQLSEDKYIEYLGKIYAEDPQYTSKIKSQLKSINFKSMEQ